MKYYFIIGICALLSGGCGGGGNSMPHVEPSPTSTTASPTPLPTRSPLPETCRIPDPPITWAVAQRMQDAPPFSGLVLRLDLPTLEWSTINELDGFIPAGLSFVDCAWGWMVGRTVVDEFNTLVENLYQTTDGGESWGDRSENIDRSTFAGGYILQGVRCVSRDRCLAFGTRPVGPDPIADSPPLILLTTDGGVTWTASQITPTPMEPSGGNLRNASIYRLCLTDSGVGLAAGAGASGSLRLLTNDRGASWRDITALGFGDVACAGERTLWTVGERLQRSTDGGQSWTDLTDRLPASASQAELDIPPSFIDDQTGWLFAHLAPGNDLVLRTTDGGESWTEISQLPQVQGTTFGNRLDFSTTTLGITSGRRTNDAPGFAASAATRDGGATWTPTSFDPDVLRIADLSAIPLN